ncbi:MAG: hypothetical protein NXI10_11680 [bacterium]|nr:hypothetical protein [bacterium]
MKKLMKPVVFLFAIAVSAGAYAQQDKPARPVKKQVRTQQMVKQPAAKPQAGVKQQVVQNRDADIKRIVRSHGLTTAEIK